jgi:hypothetical protein
MKYKNMPESYNVIDRRGMQGPTLPYDSAPGGKAYRVGKARAAEANTQRAVDKESGRAFLKRTRIEISEAYRKAVRSK